MLKWLVDKPRSCFFFDRDGTLIEHLHYLYKFEDVKLIPEMVELVKLANKSGWWTVVVTNQSGVARQKFTIQDCDLVHKHIDEELAKKNARVDGWYFCFHHFEFNTESLLWIS